jgi:hypothetical protein
MTAGRLALPDQDGVAASAQQVNIPGPTGALNLVDDFDLSGTTPAAGLSATLVPSLLGGACWTLRVVTRLVVCARSALLERTAPG